MFSAPAVSDEMRALAPGFTHVVVEAHGLANGPSTEESSALLDDAAARPDRLVGELVRDPEAFAILYDAERAYFAHYLERLTDRGGDPDFRPADGEPRDAYASTATTWPDNDLQDIAERVGALMKHRAAHTRDGAIPDVAAFDEAVARYTRGAYRAAAREVTGRPPMGDIADRPVSGPMRGEPTDGRHQLLTVLGARAEARNVPEARAAAMRRIVDNAYVRGIWLMA